MSYIKCDACKNYDGCYYIMKDSIEANSCDDYVETETSKDTRKGLFKEMDNFPAMYKDQ